MEEDIIYYDIIEANKRIKNLEAQVLELNQKIEEAVIILDTVKIDVPYNF